MSLYYKEYGNTEGPLMLFIHGGGVGGWMWDKQVQYFTDYYCIVPDLPEQGDRECLSLFSIKDSAQKLIELIEKKGVGKKIIVIGFSLGAQIVIEMLSIKPNLIHRAIINSASVRPVPFASTLIKLTIAMSFPLINNRRFSKLQAKALYIHDDQFETYYEQSLAMTSDSLTRVLNESLNYTLPADFAKANSEILVTVGSKEKATMLKSSYQIVKSNANCTGIVLDGFGHGIMLAQPSVFNELIDNWLSKGVLPDRHKLIR